MTLSVAESRAVAKNAYIYAVPLVAQYKTIYAYSVDKSGRQYMGPFNTILNIARVFTPEDTAFVTPNSDTPYSFACLDLRAEPLVITVPKMESSRYFVFQLMDLYTFNFAYIGTRTTGNNGGTYLIAGPTWKGEAPERHHSDLPCRNRTRQRRRPNPALQSRRPAQREADPGGIQSSAAARVHRHLCATAAARARLAQAHRAAAANLARLLQPDGLSPAVLCPAPSQRNGAASELHQDRHRTRQALRILRPSRLRYRAPC